MLFFRMSPKGNVSFQNHQETDHLQLLISTFHNQKCFHMSNPHQRMILWHRHVQIKTIRISFPSKRNTKRRNQSITVTYVAVDLETVDNQNAFLMAVNDKKVQLSVFSVPNIEPNRVTTWVKSRKWKLKRTCHNQLDYYYIISEEVELGCDNGPDCVLLRDLGSW